MMTPRARGPLADLLADKQITAAPTGWAGCYLITCQQCGTTWTPTLRPDGRLPTGYWRCPQGCNAPAEKPQPAALPPAPKPAPVLDLAALPALLTAEEVAAVLRLHQTTVKLLLGAGKLPGRKIGGQWRMLKTELLAYLGAGLTEEAPAARDLSRKDTEGAR